MGEAKPASFHIILGHPPSLPIPHEPRQFSIVWQIACLWVKGKVRGAAPSADGHGLVVWTRVASARAVAQDRGPDERAKAG